MGGEDQGHNVWLRTFGILFSRMYPLKLERQKRAVCFRPEGLVWLGMQIDKVNDEGNDGQ